MKRKIVSAMLCVAMASSMILVGCSSSTTTTNETSETKTETSEDGSEDDTQAAASGELDGTGLVIGNIPRSAGNPYCEREASGFEEAVEATGAEVITTYPEEATAEAEIPLIQSFISQGVDAICIAANDTSALSASLQEAMEAGIGIITADADVAATDRAVFINQAGTTEVAQSLVDAVYDLCGGEGQWAIVSATSQATNQNAWIAAMEDIIAADSKYADLELVEIAYGDDETQKSTDVTQALLQSYPDLKCICAPTTVGIAAAAKVLQDEGSSVKLTGLGLPSEMQAYIGEGDDYPCPYMYLWNPIDLGSLAGYVSVAIAQGILTGAEGETFTCPMGDFTVTLNADGATEIILGPPYEFNPENIAEWAEVY